LIIQFNQYSFSLLDVILLLLFAALDWGFLQTLGLINKHGVTLHLTSSNEGLALSIAAAGLKISMN
jgi:hypothetical protein